MILQLRADDFSFEFCKHYVLEAKIFPPVFLLSWSKLSCRVFSSEAEVIWCKRKGEMNFCQPTFTEVALEVGGVQVNIKTFFSYLCSWPCSRLLLCLNIWKNEFP